MNPVSISVVIPTFNRPPILERCIDSLEQLDYPRGDFEVIVVNDGGNAPRDSRKRDIDLTILTQPNRGPGSARNTGVANARGEFIAFIDDDCIVPRDWATKLLAALRKSPHAMVGGRTVNALTSNKYSAASQSLVDYMYRYYDGSAGRPRFFTSNNFAVSADLFRRIGGFDESFRAAEDREFCRRWNEAGHPMVYDESVVVLHAHDLGALSFHAQHFNYGRGAYPYWRKSSRKLSGLRVEPLSFYTGMLAAPMRSRVPSAPLIAALTISTQIANAAGFFFEMSKSLLLHRSGSLVDHSILHHKAHALGDVNIL